MNKERKLVTIRKITELLPIEGADRIELAVLETWRVVVEKGLHKVGDLVIYCEIDSWIPNEIAPFLSKGKEPREYNGVKGEKLRTVRLRGQLSQGLILPISILNKNQKHNIIGNFKFKDVEFWEVSDNYFNRTFLEELSISQFDLSEALNIQKWEAPIPANMNGVMKGNFPSFISKTDQERIQNLWKEYKEKYNDLEFEVSIKLDGTSFTCYYNEGTFGVCSRNLELIEDENNIYWKIANKYKLKEVLEEYNCNIAIQGELMGEGIQGNIEKLKGQDLFIFNIYSINKRSYLKPEDTLNTIYSLNNILENKVLPKFGILKELEVENTLKSIPILKESIKLSDFETIEDILKFAEGKSLNADCREGLVFKSKNLINENIISFKVINNEFLLKYE